MDGCYEFGSRADRSVARQEGRRNRLPHLARLFLTGRGGAGGFACRESFSTISQAAYRQRGVTLIEMMIVVAIAGIMAVIALPSFSNGLDNLRLSQASDSVAAFLNGALNRSERRQQVVEVSILPRENTILLRSPDESFSRTLAMPDGVQLEGDPRRVLLLPGSVPPRFGIRLANRRGMRRIINVDPITGVPQIDRVETP